MRLETESVGIFWNIIYLRYKYFLKYYHIKDSFKNISPYQNLYKKSPKMFSIYMRVENFLNQTFL